MMIMGKQFNRRLVAIFGSCMLGLTATAGIPADCMAGTAMVKLIEVLHKNGTIDQEAYDALMAAALEDQQGQTVAPPTQEAIEKTVEKVTESKLPKFDTNGKLQVTSPDGNFKFRIGGRLQADAAAYSNDTGTWKDSDLESGTEVRRSRIFLSGSLWKDWTFKTQWEFAYNRVRLKDQLISYKGFNPLELTLGNFKEPQGLSAMTSSNYGPFMERPMAVDAFEPYRKMGLRLHYNGEFHGAWTAATGFFGGGVNLPDTINGEGWGIPARITWAPIHEKDKVLHFGTSIEYRAPDDSNSFIYLARPESHIANHAFVNTGIIEDVDYRLLNQVEVLGIMGPFSLQGEYFWNSINRRGGAEDLDFTGGYVLGSWFLTGESRKYKAKYGSFSQVKPNHPLLGGGIGAWEVAARYSTLDLSDGTIQGGSEDNLTLGLNWYPGTNVRFMFNYIKVLDVSVDREDSYDDVSPDIVQFRTQFFF
jgi:phosphate-selective porin OprO/OprP